MENFMNIGNLAKLVGIDRSADNTARNDGKRADTSRHANAFDLAAISSDGRDAAALLEARIAKAMAGGPDRADLVAQAARKLADGGLDSNAVFADVAAQMLESDFKTS
ncbi:MAG: hypothetical protein NT107_09260 [Planctomycetota bacterium]|jgi:hypothetical protein|nr:hypothetical protein [Planctomycetota bacterium]